MVDPARRPALEGELADALRERERLDVVISYLSEKLGVPAPTVSDHAHSTPGTPRVDTRTGRVDPLSLVTEGEFFGQTSTAAAFSVLKKVRRPNNLKTEQLLRAIRKGGVPIKDSGTLYRSLTRNPKFRRVGKGLWGLSEWYPSAATPASRPPREEADDHAEASEAESEERPGEEDT